MFPVNVLPRIVRDEAKRARVETNQRIEPTRARCVSVTTLVEDRKTVEEDDREHDLRGGERRGTSTLQEDAGSTQQCDVEQENAQRGHERRRGIELEANARICLFAKRHFVDSVIYGASMLLEADESVD